jgi:hypothetical protein
MTTIKVEFPAGWNSFSESKEVLGLIEEIFGTWHYMSFTSDTAIWASRDDSSCSVFLAFENYESERIVEFVINVGDGTASCCRLIESFIDRLIRQHDLICKSVPPGK